MRALSIVLLMAVILCVGDVEGSVVTNGGFETGNLNGWTWNPAPDVSNAIVMFDVYGSDGASRAFQANPTLGPMGTAGTLSQWLLLEAGTTYAVSWEQGMQNIGLASINTTGAIELRLGSQLLSRWSQGVLGANGYAGLCEVKEFTPVTTGNYELNFRFVREAGSYGDSTVYMYVDNIDVYDPAVVPEPASVAIWSVIGVLAFGSRRWFRRRCV